MNKYHPFLVVLHWIMMFMILVGFFSGGGILSNMDNADPEKLDILKIHMSLGITVLILVVVRLITRMSTKKPKHADIGNKLLNKLAVIAHYAFYIILIFLTLSGIGIADGANLFNIVFANSGDSLQANFDNIEAYTAHGIIAKILMFLVVTHILASLYHQFVRKDSLLSRMWFGKRH